MTFVPAQTGEVEVVITGLGTVLKVAVAEVLLPAGDSQPLIKSLQATK